MDKEAESIRILRDKTETTIQPRLYYRFHLWLKRNENGREKAYALCESLREGLITEIKAD